MKENNVFFNTTSLVMLVTLPFVFSLIAGLIGSGITAFSFLMCGVTVRIMLHSHKNVVALIIFIVSLLGLALALMIHAPQNFFLPLPVGLAENHANIITAIALTVAGMMLPPFLAIKPKKGIGWLS